MVTGWEWTSLPLEFPETFAGAAGEFGQLPATGVTEQQLEFCGFRECAGIGVKRCELQVEGGGVGGRTEGQGRKCNGGGGAFDCGGVFAVADDEPGVIELFSGLGQLQAEETADGLFQWADGLDASLRCSLFPGEFKAFQATSQFKALCLGECSC